MAEMTPLERVARVLCEIEGGDPDEVRHGAGHAAGQTWLGWEAHASNARKVIEAIREPSSDMLAHVHDTLLYHISGNELDTAAIVWDRFIEALLDESDAGR